MFGGGEVNGEVVDPRVGCLSDGPLFVSQGVWRVLIVSVAVG